MAGDAQRLVFPASPARADRTAHGLGEFDPCADRGVPQLESLLLALSRQHLPPRRLIVAVESEDDPAFGRVGACIDQVSFPVLRVVAGLAQSSGQKSRNLLAALALIDDADEAVVLLDADVMPSPE